MKLKQSLEIAKKVLEIKGKPLNPNKLYQEAESLGLGNQITFSGKTPWATFARDIYMDLKNNPNSIFEKVQDKPILIKLKGQKVGEIEYIEENKMEKENFHERDLHPLLANFINLDSNFDAFPKTIYHERSSKKTKGYDKWLYPDMVGVKFEEFSDDILKFISKFNQTKIKIFSFEVKRELTVLNFREYYFQAVSNSSWANEGYLVALNIDEQDSELIELIAKSSLSFGIGVISLNSKNIEDSKILAPAKFKESLDLNVIDELLKNNPDFKGFINTIYDFDVKYPHRYRSEFDKILDIEEIEKHIKDKRIF